MHKYTKQLCSAMLDFYTLCYTNTPFYINEESVVNELLSDSANVGYLTDKSSGKIRFDKPMVDYACIRCKDEDFIMGLRAYSSYLDAKEKLEACNEMINKLSQRTGKGTISVFFRVSGGVSHRNSLKLLKEFFYDCEDEGLITVNVGDCLIHTLMLEIGYSEEEYLTHKNSGKSFFISGISQEEEESLVSLITEGVVDLDTEFGKVLSKHIFMYYRDYADNHEHKTNLSPFHTMIYTKALPLIVDKLNAFRSNISDGVRPVFMEDYAVYFACEKEKQEFHLPTEIKVGNFTLGGNFEPLITTDIFNGCMGVFSKLPQDDCIPVYLKGFGVMYYNLIDEDWLPDTESKLLSDYDLKTSKDFEMLVSKFTDNPLANELIHAVFNARMGNFTYRFKMDTSNVTEMEYCNACEESVQVLGYSLNVI